MTQNTPPRQDTDNRAPRPDRAAALFQRVDHIAGKLETLRKTLHALASVPTGMSDSEYDDQLAAVWTALDAAVAGLESAAGIAGREGAVLARTLLDGAAESAAAAPALSSTSPDDLESLIRAQRAALDALTDQIGAAESALSPRMPDGEPGGPAYGAVEIQDVNEFLEGSPIASVPVNASYYQRILEAARATDEDKRPMGAILLEAGLITDRQLKNALRHQREGKRRPLGALLVDLGYTTDTAIAQAIAAQLALPFVTLAQETVRQDALEVIPVHMARRHGCFPVNMHDGSLYVAMANPLDLIALEDLRIASGRHVRPCVASREEITAHINRHYSGSLF